MSPAGNTTQLQALIDLAANGDNEAYGELIAQASTRLLKLTRKMLRGFPRLQRWEATDDVFQTAALRLYRSLSEVQPGSVRDFFGLATLQIRRTLLDLARQAARGLEHAHSMGIVHRDIKPANLLLDKKGVVKILDMGLARMENADADVEHTVSQELTQAGMVMGTVAYLAPEQALDTRNADARSDMYSLGCTLYFLLTAKVPYQEDTMMKTIMAHREGAIPSLCDARQGVPAELDAIFQKMVAKQPADRFQSMTELLSALERLLIKDEGGQQPVVSGSEAMYATATFIDTSRAFVEPTVLVAGQK